MTPSPIISRFLSMPPRGIDPRTRLRIEPGTIADYDALAHHHYRAGRPATWVQVLRAIDPDGERVVAVLVVSMPTLNGAWRKIAWPQEEQPTHPSANIGDICGFSPRQAAEQLNASTRCISRLVVHPAYRGLGVASMLVRAYLDNPLTERTEALAAMAPFSPVFEAAGMRRITIPPTAADTRLRAALHRARVKPASLAEPGRARAILARKPAVRSALRAWGWKWKGVRVHLKSGNDVSIARIAGARLVVERVAFVAGK